MEDAQATMELYKLVEVEREQHLAHNPPKRLAAVGMLRQREHGSQEKQGCGPVDSSTSFTSLQA